MQNRSSLATEKTGIDLLFHGGKKNMTKVFNNLKDKQQNYRDIKINTKYRCSTTQLGTPSLQ